MLGSPTNHVDTNGRPINIGDVVVSTANNTPEIWMEVVIGATAKQLKVTSLKHVGDNYSFTRPSSCVSLESLIKYSHDNLQGVLDHGR
jgi:hypothetical protein